MRLNCQEITRNCLWNILFATYYVARDRSTFILAQLESWFCVRNASHQFYAFPERLLDADALRRRLTVIASSDCSDQRFIRYYRGSICRDLQNEHQIAKLLSQNYLKTEILIATRVSHLLELRQECIIQNRIFLVDESNCIQKTFSFL